MGNLIEEITETLIIIVRGEVIGVLWRCPNKKN
jgi:hypothetical protein